MAELQPETILILEDDPGVARLQQMHLERAGFQTVHSSTIDEAREKLQSCKVDLLVLDYKLAGREDGLNFYQKLRDDGETLPAIIVTGFGDDATVIKAMRAGIDDFVQKKSSDYLAYLADSARRLLHKRRDDLERDAADQAVREANERLEKAMQELHAKTAELQSTTQQLWQSAKLASVGELAASIAHELNNPLGTISLRIESLLGTTPVEDPRHRSLEIIEQEIDRMARLVGNLLQFCRFGREQISTVNVIDEIAVAAELTQHHLKRRNVKFITEHRPDLPVIYADRQKLRQVFLNLFTNAGDAMPHGGTLSVSTDTALDQAGQPAVAIEVKDTGEGIPPDLLPKVLDPFVTTKEEGKGTGLGLAICKRIIKEHQGTIEVTSEVGRGTTIKIVLPQKNDANVNLLSAS